MIQVWPYVRTPEYTPLHGFCVNLFLVPPSARGIPLYGVVDFSNKFNSLPLSRPVIRMLSLCNFALAALHQPTVLSFLVAFPLVCPYTGVQTGLLMG